MWSWEKAAGRSVGRQSVQCNCFMRVISDRGWKTYRERTAGIRVKSRNPPTPAVAKAGAAPGTTAGVEPVPFPGLQMPTTVTAFAVPALQPAVCLHSRLLFGRSSLLFASLEKP